MSKSSDEIIHQICTELDEEFSYAINQLGQEVLIGQKDGQNPVCFLARSQDLKNIVRRKSLERSFPLSDNQYKQIENHCIDQAFLSQKTVITFLRTAPIKGGFAIDVGDSNNTRIHVTESGVEVLMKSSEVLFIRSPSMLPFVLPGETPNLGLIVTYLNLSPPEQWLLIAWITYTLAHAKVDTTNFPILVLLADQGSGKSFLSKVIIRLLVDPSRLGIQGFPTTKQDMILATQHAHLQVYDNLTYINRSWSNTLCITATGGQVSNRKLYSNEGIVNHSLHAPLVLNGISNFITTSDLSSRCISLELLPIEDGKRKSETELVENFLADLPAIFSGCLELSAKVLKVLPNVEPKYPVRMLDLMNWVAAVEQVEELPEGSLQKAYYDILNDSQHDAVMSDPLGLAVYELVTSAKAQKPFWTGTPAALLIHLNTSMDVKSNHRSTSWPANAIALSKRLRTLKAALLSQGVKVEFKRGKHRTINIVKQGGQA